MKRTCSLLLALVFALLLLTACGQAQPEPDEPAADFDPARIRTMGDAFACQAEDDYNCQTGFSETTYIFAFHVGDTYYRATAEMPKEVSEALWAIDYDEDYDRKVKELISPLELVSLENLSEQIPPQEELDRLVGKTGGELFDDGWEYWYFNLVDMEAGMKHGLFSYTVTFAYDGEPMENNDDFDFYKEFRDLKVSSVRFAGLGDAANPG